MCGPAVVLPSPPSTSTPPRTPCNTGREYPLLQETLPVTRVLAMPPTSDQLCTTPHDWMWWTILHWGEESAGRIFACCGGGLHSCTSKSYLDSWTSGHNSSLLAVGRSALLELELAQKGYIHRKQLTRYNMQSYQCSHDRVVTCTSVHVLPPLFTPSASPLPHSPSHTQQAAAGQL